MPYTIIGSADGFFKQNLYIDYRFRTGWELGGERFGFPITQVFATMLQAMDVPPSEFQALNSKDSDYFGRTGYGNMRIDTASNIGTEFYTRKAYAKFEGYDASTILPLIKA